MINRLLKVILLIIITGTIGYSQEQFIQFTYFDQLTWAADGNQLAFRCILLDESNPGQLKSNILIKDLANDRLICINPQPERFIISQDKKHLLFSSSYGLFLVSLKEKNRTALVYFRNPAATWFFQDFGFVDDGTKFYMDRYDYATAQTIQDTYQIQSSKFSTQFIGWAETKKIDKKSRTARFDLHVDEMKGKLQTSTKINDLIIEFLPQPDSDDPGNFKLVYQPSRKNPFHAVLLDRCRPRLLSVNPDSTEIIVSVFKQGSHKTYRLPFAAKNLIPIENKRYFSVSWLDADRYICLTEDGLFLRNIDLTINEKIERWGLPAWCQSIELAVPQYELQVGFEPDKNRAEQILANLLKSGYFARIKYFKDQLKEGYRIRVGGFIDRQQAQAAGLELKRKGFDYWIDQVHDLYDYFNAQRSNEQKSFSDKNEAVIEYKFDNYLRSRIVLQSPGKKEQIIVEEMNNISGRAVW
jgi:hypothetical protein